MKVLLTGGAGFIGSHLVDRLLEEGHTVRVLDALVPQVHPSGERPDYLAGDAELLVGDVADRDAVALALEGVDIVVHLAAAVGVGQSMYELELYTRTNSLGTAIVLDEAVKRRDRIRKLLVASSMSVYGEGQYTNEKTGERGLAPRPRPVEQLRRREWELRTAANDVLVPEPTSETKPLAPQSIYAIGKRDQEEMCLTIGAAYGIPTVALRFFSAYGPRQTLSNPYNGAVAIFATRLRNGRAPFIFEDGEQTRDFVHVRDVARAMSAALSRPEADGRVVNVGSGEPVTIRELAEAVASALGVAIAPEILGEFRPGDVRHCVADLTLAADLLGFRPEIPLEAGLPEVVDWIGRAVPEDRSDSAFDELAERGLIVRRAAETAP